MEHGNYLKWKHIRPIENERGEVIAAKIIVYADDVFRDHEDQPSLRMRALVREKKDNGWNDLHKNSS